MVQLKTERLIIRDTLMSDIDGYHRLMSDPENMYYLQDLMTHSLEESRQHVEIAVADVRNPNRTKYYLVIEECQTGAYVGATGYTVTQTTPVGKIVNVGYFILPEYHGRGYMTEAVREVIRFAFEENGVYRIETGCLAENCASERVMQKCGMIKEADRKAAIWHDGRMKDRVEYRLLKGEWLG